MRRINMMLLRSKKVVIKLMKVMDMTTMMKIILMILKVVSQIREVNNPRLSVLVPIEIPKIFV